MFHEINNILCDIFFKCIYNSISNANLSIEMLIDNFHLCILDIFLILAMREFRFRKLVLLAQGQRPCLKNG